MDTCVALDAPHADESLSRPALQAIHHNALKRLPCARRFKIPELPTSERALCLVRLGTLPLDGLLHRLVNLGSILRQECLSAIKVQRLVKIAIKDRVGREDLAVATIANRINIAESCLEQLANDSSESTPIAFPGPEWTQKSRLESRLK